MTKLNDELYELWWSGKFEQEMQLSVKEALANIKQVMIDLVNEEFGKDDNNGNRILQRIEKL